MEVLTSGSVITDSIDKTEAIDSFDLKLSAHDVEDDDVCVVLKRGRVSRLHLEDSDDETETANEELDTKDTDHADDEESSNKKSETEGHLNTSSKRRSRIIRVESSSDEENDEGPNERLRNDGFEGGKKTFEKNYQPSDINVNVNTDMNNVKQRLPFSNDDLFDAEESDKENEEERSALPSYDETIDGEICLDNIKKSAKLLVKTDQNPNSIPKRQRSKKNDLTELHSESQRIVRKARVKLPYHVPEQRTLDDFLNRRKSAPLVLKPTQKQTIDILQQYISENSKQRKSTSVRKLDLDGNHHVCRNVEETAATDPEKPTDSNDDKPTFQPLCGEISASKSESLPDEFKVIPDSADAALHLENNSQNEDNSLVLSSEVPLNSVAQEFTSTKDSELPKESTELQKIDAVLKENGHHETVSPTSPFDIQTDTIPKFDGTPDMEISLERNEFSQAKDSTILIESHDLKNANATSLANGHHQSVIPNSRFIVPKDIIPKLDGAPNTEICLEDESPQKRGVQSLIHRFMIHTSTMRTHCEPHEVEMSILKKAKDSSGEEILTTEKLTVSTGHKSDIFDDARTPGAKLSLLKDSLRAQIAKKRAEARKLMLSNKDNNEKRCSEDETDEDMEDEEDEEEQMSDSTESESEEEDEDEDLDVLKDSKKRPSNVFIDDEAEEDRDCSGSEDCNSDSGLENNDDDEKSTSNLKMDGPPLNGRTSISSHSTIGLLPNSFALTKDKLLEKSECEEDETHSKNQSIDSSVDTSFEILGSLIPGHQPGGGMLHRQSSLTTTVEDNYSPLKKTLSSLSYPFVNSQLLAVPDDDSPQLFRSQFPPEDFNIPSSVEMFSSVSIPKTGGSEVDDLEVPTQPNVSGLQECTWSTSANKGIRTLWDPLTQTDTQRNMDELLDLCSGQFPASNPTQSIVSTVIEDNVTHSLPEFDEINKSKPSDDESSVSSFKMDIEHRRKRMRLVLSDDSDDEADDDKDEQINLSNDEDSKEVIAQKKRILEYFEDEAELSGSDASSDEDEDLQEENDAMEEELGDLEHYSEDEIKDQVGRMHMKMMMDDDQRRLRLFKELYLEDGDLHCDGQGRTRKFRWRNVGKDEEFGEAREMDSETEEIEDAETLGFRVKRHEREKWLSEQQRTGDDELTEDIKFSNVKKKVLMPRCHSMESTNTPNRETHSESEKKIILRGSFLSRSKAALARMASLTKGLESDNLNGPRNSRNFVFAAVSPQKEDEPPAKMRRTMSNTSNMSKKPMLAKRLSLPCQGIQDDSIFNLF